MIDGMAIDMFSFGVLCHEVLTGKMPVLMGAKFEADTRLNPAILPHIIAMLSSDPALRPKSSSLLFSPFFAQEEAISGVENRPSVQSIRSRLSNIWDRYSDDSDHEVPIEIQRNDAGELECADVAAVLGSLDEVDWKGGHFVVTFSGERGIDAGGLTRDFFSSGAQALHDQLFVIEDEGSASLPAEGNNNHLPALEMFGRFVGRALLQGLLLPELKPICGSFWKYLVGRKAPSFLDFADFSGTQDYLRLQNLRMLSTEELKAKGYTEEFIGTNVTKESCLSFIEERIVEKLVTARLGGLEAFRTGLAFFPEIESLLQEVSSTELRCLVIGQDVVTSQDIIDLLVFRDFPNTSKMSEYFPQMLSRWDSDGLSDFLLFCTGSRGLILNGNITVFYRTGGVDAASAKNRLPNPHTCFNHVDIPDYPSVDHMESKFLTAMGAQLKGFGEG
jgi:hypothetical protein